MRVKEYLRRKVAFFASVIEIAISIIVLIAIVIAGIQVVREVFSLAGDPKAHEGFTVFLGHAFNTACRCCKACQPDHRRGVYQDAGKAYARLRH